MSILVYFACGWPEGVQTNCHHKFVTRRIYWIFAVTSIGYSKDVYVQYHLAIVAKMWQKYNCTSKYASLKIEASHKCHMCLAWWLMLRFMCIAFGWRGAPDRLNPDMPNCQTTPQLIHMVPVLATQSKDTEKLVWYVPYLFDLICQVH